MAGPMAATGILYAGSDIGTLGSPLSGNPGHAIGFALGHQWIMEAERRQLTVELGGRANYSSTADDGIALGGRFQQAIGQRYILIVDVYFGYEATADLIGGGRLELLIRF